MPKKLSKPPEKKKFDNSSLVAVLAVIFGILILIKPDVLAILIALYLIVYGISELIKK